MQLLTALRERRLGGDCDSDEAWGSSRWQSKWIAARRRRLNHEAVVETRTSCQR